MKKLNKKQFWNEIFKLRSYGDFMFSRWRTQKTLAYRILSKDTTPIKQLYVQIFLRKLFRSILIAVVGACICIMWNLIKESAILDGISYIIIIVCLTLIIGEYYIGMDKYILLREQRKRNMYKNFPKIAPLVITEIELEKEKFQKHIQEKKTELEICNGFLKEIDTYNQLLIIKNALGNKVYTLHPKFIKKEILVQLIMQEAIGTTKEEKGFKIKVQGMTNDQYIEITDLHEDKYDELIQTLVNPTINEIKSDIGFLTRIIKNLENQIKFTKENM